MPKACISGWAQYIGSTALAEALRYVNRLGMDNIAVYEDELLRYATDKLNAIEGMRIFGQADHKGAVLSFLVGNIHHYDMGMLLDRLGIAVRTGHHCAQPLMQALGIEGTVRASFSLLLSPDLLYPAHSRHGLRKPASSVPRKVHGTAPYPVPPFHSSGSLSRLFLCGPPVSARGRYWNDAP